METANKPTLVPTGIMETLDDLARALESARNREQAAREYREEIENKLAAILGHDERTTTFEGDDYQVTTQSQTIRSTNNQDAAKVSEQLGQALTEKLFPLSHKLNTGAYLDLRDSDRVAFAIASQAVTVTHARPSIVVNRREG